MIKIHQETFGSGKPIVMVPGWAMHTGIWRDFAMALGKSYKVTCVDLPGHGQSEKLPEFSLEFISSELVDSVLDETSCWLGWSLGATVVLDIARRFPERCKAIILLAGNPHFTRTDQWPGIRKQALNAFNESFSIDSQTTLMRFLSLQINGLPNFKEHVKALKTTLSQYPAPDQETLSQGLNILKESDLRSDFSRLDMPVTAIFGAMDALVPVKVSEKMQDLLPELEVYIIDRAGHIPFLTHQDETLSIISRFIDKQ